MRVHRSYRLFDLWTDPKRLRRIVAADTLVAARIEPMMRQSTGFGVVDLTFVRDGEIAVVPFVQVEGSMLAEPERSPFVWPLGAGEALDDATTDAIESKVLPWILAHFLGRRLNDELVRTYDAARAQLFQRARSYGFLGAAPYARVAQAAAPYIYAQRLARGGRVAIVDDPAGASGAAILAGSATEVTASFGTPDLDAFARAWFADRFGAASTAGSFAVAIGARDAELPRAAARVTLHDDVDGAIPIARPIPVDVLFSFDPEDSEKVDAFSVVAPEPELRRRIGGPTPPAVGGSGGRLLFALRNDALRAPDADTDDASALAARLRAEGFEVDLLPASSIGDLSGYDLMHAFTLTAIADLGEVLVRARAAGLPIVATAHLDDIEREGVWGAGISAGIHLVTLDDEVAIHLAAIERRALEAENLNPKGQVPFKGYTEAVAGGLAVCDALLVSGAAEERFIREKFGFTGIVAPAGPCLTEGEAPAGLGALIGSGEFVLAHSPVAPRSNLLALARAAMEANVPLVIAGPIVDTSYAGLLRELCDARVTLLPTASAEAIAALYRRARVYADVGWEDRGMARVASAALAGASLVLAHSHYAVELIRPGVWAADRASGRSIVQALQGAWAGAGRSEAAACAARVAAYCDPIMALTSVVTAYARAQSLRPGASGG